MPAHAPITEDRTALSLIRDLERLRGTACPDCGGPRDGRQTLMSIALGFKDAPRCLACLSSALEGGGTELHEQLFHYIQRHDCFREAWAWACQEEGAKPDDMPARAVPRVEVPHPPDIMVPLPAAFNPVVRNEWDAGDLGCGELVLELRLRLQALAPGDIFKLCARDPGAPEDLPAWCRMTGHGLVRAEPPNYWIKRKD